MRITTLDQCVEGMLVKIYAKGTLTVGVLCVEGRDVWVCTDNPDLDGSTPARYCDKRFGWKIVSGSDLLTDNEGIFTTHPLSPARKLLKDRIQLIRTLIKVVDKVKLETTRATLLTIIDTIRKDNNNTFLSYSQEETSRVSYTSKVEFKYENSSRTKTSLGRYIRRQLNITESQLSNPELAVISNAVFGELLDVSNEIEVVDGDRITKAYKDEVGCYSCMTGSSSRCVSMYALNPDKVKLVIYGKTNARALLWTCDDGTIVLDRIYPNSGGHIDKLHNWCIKRGYAYRTHQGAPTSKSLLSDEREHIVTMKHDRYFPYMDTFKWAKIIDDSEVELSSIEDSKHSVLLDSCDGNINTVSCESCGNEIDEDDIMSYGDCSYCHDCFDDLFSYCDNCENAYPRDDLQSVEYDYLCSRCYDEHTMRCDNCGDRYYTSNIYEDGLCESCYENRLAEEKEVEEEEEELEEEKEEEKLYDILPSIPVPPPSVRILPWTEISASYSTTRIFTITSSEGGNPIV